MMLTADVREWVREQIAIRLGALITFPFIASTSSSGEADKVQATDGDTSVQTPARRIEPFGLRSRPPANIRGLVLKALSGASNAVLIGVATALYGPSDLNDGEACLYCKIAGCTILLDENGSIVGSVPGGQTIRWGGTTPAARKGDPVGAGTIKFTATAGSSGNISGFVVLYTPGDGSSPQTATIVIGTPATITMHEKITDGSSVVQLG